MLPFRRKVAFHGRIPSTWISYSTISLRHYVMPRIGSNGNGSIDDVFTFGFDDPNVLKAFPASTYGQRGDNCDLLSAVAVFSFPGKRAALDLAWATPHPEFILYQRPALLFKH